jgi:hypothetical protein
MFSSTKLENRPHRHSTLREQSLFYDRSQISINIQSWFWLNKCSVEYNMFSTAIFWWFCLFLLICRTKHETVSFSELREEHLSSISVFKSLISSVQPGLINNFVPYNNRYDVFYEKYMPIKTSFHGSPLCCFIHTPCIILNSNATFAFPTPHKSQLLSPKIWETRDQPGPGSFLQRGA